MANLERIFKINAKIRAGEYPNPDALAQEFEVSRRLIFMDRQYMIDRLGAPIGYDRARGGWYYTEPTWALPAMQISEGELLALVLGAEAARRALGGDLGAALAKAVEKIGANLHGSVRIDLESLRAHCGFSVFESAPVQAGMLAAFHRAIERSEQVRILYRAAETRERRERVIDPYLLHHANEAWYLRAFDHSRQDMRTFHLGRIERYEVLPRHFRRDHAFDGDAWRTSLFQVESSDEMMEVVIRFDAYEATYIRERKWHSTQQIEELSDGGLILRFTTGAWGEVVRFALQYGSHAEVLEPQELREEIAGEARRLARKYRNAGSAGILPA